eukprot:m.1088329 g.1088329  ORF g.1088329 m.1088329 type:complete len:53 (+) comp24286_c0_seq20:1070-1228(+)
MRKFFNNHNRKTRPHNNDYERNLSTCNSSCSESGLKAWWAAGNDNNDPCCVS